MAKGPDTFKAEKKKLESEKKKLRTEQKKQKKEAKKRAKEIAAQEAELAEEEEGGGFFTFLATLAIIAVWLGIVCLIIKLDVGGFGSGVLTPLLKDVPVVNKILPAVKEGEGEDSADDTAGYTSIHEAVAQITYLEAQLQQANTDILAKDEEISELKAEVVRLQEFEKSQIEFQRIKTEFFENVIYAENGPGAEDYREYYEAMDPATADYLYKQVVEQMEEDAEIQDFADTYAAMDAKNAAAILEAMSNDMNLVARILGIMDAETRGEIMECMSAEFAAKLTKIMVPES